MTLCDIAIFIDLLLLNTLYDVFFIIEPLILFIHIIFNLQIIFLK